MSKTKAFKTSDYLKTREDRVEYLKAALDSNDEKVLLIAMREIVDSMGGMAELSRESGLARESLYKSLSDKGNPRFDTFFKVLDFIGVEINFSPKQNHAV
jgi:probable addiction module antidote protein